MRKTFKIIIIFIFAIISIRILPVRSNGVAAPPSPLVTQQKQNSQQGNISADLNSYLSIISPRIKSLWKPSRYYSSKKCILKFTVDKNGVILSPHVVQSSNNIMFDEEALITIKKASPLPPPPISSKNKIDSIDVLFTFDYNFNQCQRISTQRDENIAKYNCFAGLFNVFAAIVRLVAI